MGARRRRRRARRTPRPADEVGIGGSFVKSKHTLRHCRDYVEPGLFRFQLQQTWEAEGEKNLYERAVDEYRRLKSVIQPVDIPDVVRRDMDAVVVRADKALCP